MRSQYPLLISILLLSACGLGSRPDRGNLIDQWQTSNEVLKIRVSQYDEKGAIVSGTYYVFECAPLESDNWQEIMTFRHDDRVGIPKDQVRFVSNQIGYVYMGWMYAVTKDAGANWSVWDAKKDLPNWQCCNYGLVRDVRIGLDNAGVMRLNLTPQRRGEAPELHTKDFGQHWVVKDNDA